MPEEINVTPGQTGDTSFGSIFDQVQGAPAQTTIDSNTLAIEDAVNMQQVFPSKAEARRVEDMAETLDIDCSIDKTTNGYLVTLKSVNKEQLSILQRKLNIQKWSIATINVAQTVTHFVEDVADYALNGAIAPAAVSVADAAFTTGRVVGTAAVRIGAGTLATTVKNGRQMYKDLANASEIKDCGREFGQLFSDISTKLTGTSSNSGWTVVAG